MRRMANRLVRLSLSRSLSLSLFLYVYLSLSLSLSLFLSRSLLSFFARFQVGECPLLGNVNIALCTLGSKLFGYPSPCKGTRRKYATLGRSASPCILGHSPPDYRWAVRQSVQLVCESTPWSMTLSGSLERCVHPERMRLTAHGLCER